MNERPDSEQPRHPETGERLETMPLDEQTKQARRKRNLAIAVGLFAFAVLVFAVTVMRLSSNIAAGG